MADQVPVGVGYTPPGNRAVRHVSPIVAVELSERALTFITSGTVVWSQFSNISASPPHCPSGGSQPVSGDRWQIRCEGNATTDFTRLTDMNGYVIVNDVTQAELVVAGCVVSPSFQVWFLDGSGNRLRSGWGNAAGDGRLMFDFEFTVDPGGWTTGDPVSFFKPA